MSALCPYCNDAVTQEILADLAEAKKTVKTQENEIYKLEKRLHLVKSELYWEKLPEEQKMAARRWADGDL